jgi:hypothetical protein
MSFAERMATASTHEIAVKQRLNDRNWQAELFGQILLPPNLRDLLKQYSDDYGNPTLLRWLPDILAGYLRPGRAYCCLIDAKTCGPNQKNYAVEKSAIDALAILTQALHIPSFFVFDDWGVLTAHIIQQRGWSGPDHGNGSGTAYFLVERRYSLPFDRIFPPIAITGHA